MKLICSCPCPLLEYWLKIKIKLWILYIILSIILINNNLIFYLSFSDGKNQNCDISLWANSGYFVYFWLAWSNTKIFLSKFMHLSYLGLGKLSILNAWCWFLVRLSIWSLLNVNYWCFFQQKVIYNLNNINNIVKIVPHLEIWLIWQYLHKFKLRWKT